MRPYYLLESGVYTKLLTLYLILTNRGFFSRRNEELKTQPPSLQQTIGTKKFGLNDREQHQKTLHSLSILDVKGLGEKFKRYVIHMISGQYSGVARIFEIISSE